MWSRRSSSPGNLETVTSSGSVTTTIGQDDLEKLAVARNITEAVDLVPGAHRTGPTRAGNREGNISISGAMSFENLYTVNGVVVNENLRGQPLDLFIEDAIQEQTVSNRQACRRSSAGSPVARSTCSPSPGGNEFHGSLRSKLHEPGLGGADRVHPVPGRPDQRDLRRYSRWSHPDRQDLVLRRGSRPLTERGAHHAPDVPAVQRF